MSGHKNGEARKRFEQGLELHTDFVIFSVRIFHALVSTLALVSKQIAMETTVHPDLL